MAPVSSVMGEVLPALAVVRIGYGHGSAMPVLPQSPPGALMATSRPMLEKLALAPRCCKPATAMTPAQLAGAPTAWPTALPAATTTIAPVALICEMASAYAALHEPTSPRLMLRTRAGF